MKNGMTEIWLRGTSLVCFIFLAREVCNSGSIICMNYMAHRYVIDLILAKYKFIKIKEFTCYLELPLPFVEGVRVRFGGFPVIFDDAKLRIFAEEPDRPMSC
jgi:hypothetical protein